MQKWLVEKFFNYNSTKIIDYNILRTRDKKLSKEKILFKIVKCTLLKNQFYNIDNNGKDEFWALRKMELMDLINQNKTFAYELLNEYMHYKQMDDILLALNNTTVKY